MHIYCKDFVFVYLTSIVSMKNDGIIYVWLGSDYICARLKMKVLCPGSLLEPLQYVCILPRISIVP